MGSPAGFLAAAAIAAAVGGVLLLVRHVAVPSGLLLAAAAVAAPFMQAAQPAGAIPLTATLVLGGSAPALAAAAGVLWPVARITRLDRAAAGLAVGCALLLGGVVPALFDDPAAAGCNACAPDLLEVTPAIGVAAGLYRAGAASALVWGPVLVVVAVRRLGDASGLARRHAWPMLGGVGIAVLAGVSAAHGLALPDDVVDATQQNIWLAQAALMAVLAVGAVVRVLLAATAGRRMARIVVAAIPDHAVVLLSLRQAVADPALQVRYVRTDGGLIDADGAALAAGTGPVLRLNRDGAAFAEIQHAPEALGAALGSSAASAGLALEYLAARARLRAELRQAAAVRSRLVEAAGAERRRLERNLHDGAQQRLIALGLMLGPARAPEHAEIDAALQELRTIARGLFPAGLAESDVLQALRELGDHTGCPLMLSGGMAEPVPLPVKLAVYQLVSEVAEAHPMDAALEVELAGGAAGTAEVVLTTALPDGPELRSSVVHAEDRFVAAGGRLTVQAIGGTAVVRGEAPCAS